MLVCDLLGSSQNCGSKRRPHQPPQGARRTSPTSGQSKSRIALSEKQKPELELELEPHSSSAIATGSLAERKDLMKDSEIVESMKQECSSFSGHSAAGSTEPKRRRLRGPRAPMMQEQSRESEAKAQPTEMSLGSQRDADPGSSNLPDSPGRHDLMFEMLEKLPMPVLAFSGLGRFVFINNAFLEATGWRRIDLVRAHS